MLAFVNPAGEAPVEESSGQFKQQLQVKESFVRN